MAAPEIRVRDVANAGGLPAALLSRVVAVLPPERSQVTLSRAALASLVRRAVPGLDVPAGTGSMPVTLRVRALGHAPAPAGGLSCFALSRFVARGAILSSSDLAPASCGSGKADAQIAFDRDDRVTRAAVDLAAGTNVGRVALLAEPAVDRGQELTLISTAGPVQIQRKVVAAQPGRPGGKIFVRDEDGKVLTAPLRIREAGEKKR